ncbi:MAG: hypothetical protein QXN57_04090 [Desulfurococcaceae archaeon]
MDGNIESLINRVQEYLSKKIPGMLSFLNTLCIMNYGVDCITLLFTSPSRLYILLLNHYKGDVLSTDYAFTLAFLNPLISRSRNPELVLKLMELVKTGRDKEFIELILEKFQ